MKTQKVGWWILAITLSVTLHVLLYLSLDRRNLRAFPESVSNEGHVRLSFLQPTSAPPEPDPEPERETEPEPDPEPEQETELEPDPELEQETEPEPDPELERETEPEPDLEPMPETKPEPQRKAKTKSKPKAVAQAAPTPVPEQRPEPKEDAMTKTELRERYLASLLALIEKRKSYPRVARRRSIEGLVRVSFTVECDGSIGRLQIRKGHKLLKRSATKAIDLAQPFPQPPEEVKCPLPVDYVMAFELRNR